MYEHSINLFYSDSKIEKKALRNLKAQQLEDAAKWSWTRQKNLQILKYTVN